MNNKSHPNHTGDPFGATVELVDGLIESYPRELEETDIGFGR